MLIRSYNTLMMRRKIETEVTAGMIATFSEYSNFRICTDKDVPIGVFLTDTSSEAFETVFEANLVTVSIGPNEYRTDIFEKSSYKINDFIYCSCNGKISNEERYIGNIIIGIVNYVSEKEIGFITCFARNLENKN